MIQQKYFTFLLRVNKQKNVYEATIAPLGGRGIYKLNAIILDYQIKDSSELREISEPLRLILSKVFCIQTVRR
jgi:hypothetical protein